MEPKTNAAHTSATLHSGQPEQAELLGRLVDVVEDWLEEKGITVDNIPNDERDGDENDAIIYGSDYDCLVDGFATAMGLSRDGK